MGQIYCIFIGPILRARAEIQKVEMETSKFTYEINWPLAQCTKATVSSLLTVLNCVLSEIPIVLVC